MSRDRNKYYSSVVLFERHFFFFCFLVVIAFDLDLRGISCLNLLDHGILLINTLALLHLLVEDFLPLVFLLLLPLFLGYLASDVLTLDEAGQEV